LSLKHYLRFALPTPPSSADYSSLAQTSLQEMYLNDQLGDCVIAGGYHTIGVATGNANGGSPFIATGSQIVADYSAIGGYVDGDPSTDNGCDEVTALNYWQSTGFADGSQLAGWAVVDATNQAEVQAACWLFENLFFGLELPDAWISPFPSSPGFVWDVGTPDPQNGHCVAGVGYNAQGVLISTWGLIGTMTYAAIAALCVQANGGELYVMLTPDQILKGAAKAPNGVAWADLVTDLQQLNGAPASAPTPPNPAPPGGGVSLAQAQAWAAAGLQAGWPVG